jgi:hypothetical protein
VYENNHECAQSNILNYGEFFCAWLVQDIISNGVLLKYIHYVKTYSKYKYIMGVGVTQNKLVNSHVKFGIPFVGYPLWICLCVCGLYCYCVL